MKVLLINGSPHQHGCTYTALKEVADTLNKNDIETEIIWIGTKPVAGCIACGHCYEAHRCVFGNDQVNQIHDRLSEYQGIVVGSPVYYAGPSGQVQAFLDRLHLSAREARWLGNSGRRSCPAAGVEQAQRLTA